MNTPTPNSNRLMTFADFSADAGLSPKMRRAFENDLRFNLGESFDHRSREQWQRLYAGRLRVDRRRRVP